MANKLQAYRVNMITPEDAKNGAKKGQILYFHSNCEELPGAYNFIEQPGATTGIPLFMQQVARVPDYDREDTPTAEVLLVADTSTGDDVRFAEENIPPVVSPVVTETAFGLDVVVNEALPPDAVFAEPPLGAGLKYDTGKPRPSLLIRGMPRALMRVAEVLTFGAQKYEAHSWRSVENGEERYDDAKLRHMFKDAMGEVDDSESTIEHLAHECCNLLFLLEKKLTEEGYTF